MLDEDIKPHYIEPISHLAEVLSRTRSAGYDKHLDRAPGPGRTHQPGNLDRNRAALLCKRPAHPPMIS